MGHPLTTNCGCGESARVQQAHLNRGSWRLETFEGRETLVVPVVMAKAGVVMNGALLRAEEFATPAWDGVPVTVGHPIGEGSFISASQSPKVIERFAVGRVFGAKRDGQDLKGEAWIDVGKANRVMPGLVDTLKNPKAQMNVSTGYFSKDDSESGEIGGKRYNIVSREIRPNHLALLPFEPGACSWQDGCGVRPNMETSSMERKFSEQVTSALRTLGSALGVTANEDLKAFVAEDESSRRQLFDVIGRLVGNARGPDDNRRQRIADLISHDNSPFVPDDQDCLNMMSEKTLGRMAKDYLPKRKEDAMTGNAGGDAPTPHTLTKGDLVELITNAAESAVMSVMAKKKDTKGYDGPDSEPDADEDDMTTNLGDAHVMTKSELQQLVANAATEAVKATITPEMKTALGMAANSARDERARLVRKITINSNMTARQLEQMSFDTIKAIADGIIAQPDFSGQRFAANIDDASDDAGVKAMTPGNSFRPNKALQG